MKFPSVVAVLCIVPSGLMLYIGITSCTFPPWKETSKKNDYGYLPMEVRANQEQRSDLETSEVQMSEVQKLDWHTSEVGTSELLTCE